MFYATIWEDLRKVAISKGWSVALHGSLVSDMDIIAMPWTQDATSVEEFIQAIIDLFPKNQFLERGVKGITKPHGRKSYIFVIWHEFYLDVSVMDSRITEKTDIEQAIELYAKIGIELVPQHVTPTKAEDQCLILMMRTKSGTNFQTTRLTEDIPIEMRFDLKGKFIAQSICEDEVWFERK